MSEQTDGLTYALNVAANPSEHFTQMLQCPRSKVSHGRAKAPNNQKEQRKKLSLLYSNPKSFIRVPQSFTYYIFYSDFYLYEICVLRNLNNKKGCRPKNILFKRKLIKNVTLYIFLIHIFLNK